MYVFLDFEGRSKADLPKVGAWNYSAHESTEVLCLAYIEDFRRGEPWLLTPDEWGQRLDELAKDETVIFVAHHAFFEQAIWANVMVKKHGFAPIPPHRWRCTRALAWAHGLPGNLDGAAKALQLKSQKRASGKDLIKFFCIPKSDGTFNKPCDYPEKWQEFCGYCVDDVKTMREMFERLRPLPAIEQTVWEVDQIINQRGIQLDVPLLQRAQLFIEYQKYENRIAFEKLTGLPRASLRAQFQNWVNIRHGADWIEEQFINPATGETEERAVLKPRPDQAVWINNTQAGTIKSLIADTATLPDVQMAAELYQQAQKSSLIKYEKALMMSDEHGIYREVANYAGAHTLRWTSWGAQWQNPPRPKHNIENVIHALKTNDYKTFEWLYGSVTMPLSSMIRGLIIARPDHKIYVGDYVQIEARGLSWLAGDETKLEFYRQGLDVYSEGAKEVFQCEVSKKVNADKRQAYKVLELANQYGGGIGAGANFSKQYDFDPEPLYDILWDAASPMVRGKAEWSVDRYEKTALPEDRLSRKAALGIDVFKQKWRAANPKVVQYWSDLENAVKAAIYTKKPVVVGAVTWFVDDIFLYCRLPSGRDIIYPYPDVSSDGSISYWGEDNGKFVKQYTYGGKLSENVTQALCRDFLAWAMVDLELSGFPVILHLHDEAVCEVPLSDERFEEFKQVLGKTRQWAPGFPIDVDCWTGSRYDKR